MTIRTRLMLGFIPLLIVIAGLSWLSYTRVTLLVAATRWHTHTHEVISGAHLVEKLLVDMETGERGFLITGKEEFLEPYNAARNDYKKTLADLRNLVSDNPSQVSRLEEIDKVVMKWNEEAGSAEIALRRRMNQGEISMSEVAASIENKVGKEAMDQLRARLREFVATEEELLTKRTAESELSATMSNLVTIFGALGAIAFGVFAMIFTIRSIVATVGGEPAEIAAITEEVARGNLEIQAETKAATGILASVQTMVKSLNQTAMQVRSVADGDLTVEVKPLSDKDILGNALADMLASLRSVVSQAKVIAQGDYSAEIAPRSGQDELGVTLIEMTRALRTAASENEAKDWLKTGAAGLAKEMQGTQDVLALAGSVITYLAKYIGAHMGALYITDERGESLTLSGSYAFNKRKSLNAEIKIGEGLAGQAALEREVISVTNVPEDYVRINSTLGDAAPRNILAAPLVHEGQLVGVVEFASLNEFPDSDLEFLSGVLESVAISLHSAQARRQLQDLLEKTQTQTEELQVQSEELQAQSEELQTSNEELREKTETLEQQQEELQAANEELEEKTDALEGQKANIERTNARIESAKQEVEEKARQLEESSRYKSEFLANMSHELRTPLNSLLLLAEMLVKNEGNTFSEDQVESLAVIQSSGRDLLTLINEILDLSKIEAGKLHVQIGETKLEECIDTLRAQFDPVAKNKSLEFRVDIAGGIRSALKTDGKKVEQILRNLLSNAFKFTEQGSVTLRIHRPDGQVRLTQDHLRPDSTIAMSIIDTGIGIPKDKQESVFEAFQQADGSTSRKYGGTGLGLTISRELAAVLGGEIHLESHEGEGCTFSLYLPFEYEPRPDAADAAERILSIPVPVLDDSAPDRDSVPARPNMTESPFIPDDREAIADGDKSVLVIEDDARFARVLMNLSREKGYKCLAAGTGRNGLQLAHEYDPDAIILDLILPDIDGIDILENLKDDLATRHIPVHVISGRDDSGPSLNKGAVGYLKKPAGAQEIEEVFSKFETILSSSIRELLVVEDDEATRIAITNLIEDRDHLIITTTTNGKDKASRYYFKDTISLGPGEVFVSPFDLNIEHQEIERPLKPMIRFGTPFFDKADRKRGIIVLNFLGQRLLDRVDEEGHLGLSQPMLLNSEGYWLKGADASDEWGFMFEDGKDLTFANRFPQAWTAILGFARLLAEKSFGLLNDKQEKYVERVEESGEHLLSLIGDRRKCRQIMLNLLSNAVKYTPAGARSNPIRPPSAGEGELPQVHDIRRMEVGIHE